MNNCNMSNYNVSTYKMPHMGVSKERESFMRNREASCMCGEYPIGMAYVPWQKFQNLLEPEQGLEAGTIFAELEKPFWGRRAFRR